jgi:hypothetical protein
MSQREDRASDGATTTIQCPCGAVRIELGLWVCICSRAVAP